MKGNFAYVSQFLAERDQFYKDPRTMGINTIPAAVATAPITPA
jgi:hypothetical protein